MVALTKSPWLFNNLHIRKTVLNNFFPAEKDNIKITNMVASILLIDNPLFSLKLTVIFKRYVHYSDESVFTFGGGEKVSHITDGCVYTPM